MDLIGSFLAEEPILTLFLVIGLGYAVGEISIVGFSLGAGAVLFVGLLMGAMVPESVPPGILGTIGIIIFFYGIGIQYGKPFFEGLVSSTGRKQNFIAVISLIIAGFITFIVVNQLPISANIGAGVFTGALVNTAALESVMEKVGEDLPSVGYSVTYPFGVFGPILSIYLASKLLKPQIQPRPSDTIREYEVVVSSQMVRKGLGAIKKQMPPGLQIVAVRQEGQNRMPRNNLQLQAGDSLLVIGEELSREEVHHLLSEENPLAHRAEEGGSIEADHQDLDDIEVYVSKPSVIGRKLGELNLGDTLGCTVLSIQRGDAQLYPHPGLILEAGDRIRVVTEPGRFEEVQAFFGNSARSTAEVSYLGLGIGLTLGVLLGLIPFSLPGLGRFTVGAGGGAMIVSLILGKIGRSGQVRWTIPPSANLTLRNFGLTLFLAVVGMRSAEQFITTIQTTGFLLIGMGIVITLSVVIVSLILGYWLFNLSFDEVLGIIAGVTGNPAILAYASDVVPTNKPELGYAIIFPTSTLIKILVIQGVLVLLNR